MWLHISAVVVVLGCILQAYLFMRAKRLYIKEGTPSASHNSDYAAALKIYGEYVSSGVSTIEHLVTFPSWCEERLNSAKAPNCA